MSKEKVVIVDYGLGNLFNVKRALEAVGAQPVISESPCDLLMADRVVLPGVAAFGEGMKGLKKRGLVEPLREFAASGRPLLGVCLGMQLLLSESEELGHHQGLELIKGKVVRFRSPESKTESFKIPHIGWNSLQPANSKGWDGTLLKGLEDRPFMYFVHSYCVKLDNTDHAVAYSEYGYDRFCSAFQFKNISGFQGHPERSGEVGLQIYRNFLNSRSAS